MRPVLAELHRGHAEEFFASEYQLSRQEWMEKNQLVYSLQSARWKTVLSQKPPLLAPWEKGLSAALACPSTLSAAELETSAALAVTSEALASGYEDADRRYFLKFPGSPRPIQQSL